MRIDELNWMDVEKYLAQDDRLMLVLGACEQHGYLSLLTDVHIPLAFADAASQQSGVLVAPPLNFGCSPYFMSYPGTFSLRLETLIGVVEDLVRSAYRHGFRRVLILNGHGGNDPAHIRLNELLPELEGLQLRWYSWWKSHSVEALAAQHELKPAHGNWLEAFPFTRITELPEGEKTPPRLLDLATPEQHRQALGDGSFGGMYQASDEVMTGLFQTCLEDILHLLEFAD